MSSRMEKYKNNHDSIPTRSSKNQELYTQIYNAYDEFENLVVPSNAKEITIGDLKKEITSREEYRDLADLRNTKDNNKKTHEETPPKKTIDESIYDINELIDKRKKEVTKETEEKDTLTNGSYLKKLKLDNRKTNIEQVKEMYQDIETDLEVEEEDSLLKTANLSLEILSDLKGDSEETSVRPPIKDSEVPTKEEDTFYSKNYKFSKKDFEREKEKDEDEEDDDFTEDEGNGKLFFKVLFLTIGILLVLGLGIYIYINYIKK